MKVSEDVYRQVAEHCSSYTADTCTRSGATNSTRDSYKDSYTAASNSCGCKPISCTNCAHFDSNEHCTLDLYDKIVAKHNF